MDRNKLTTYLLYAIGEIFLVVIGILIALAIDSYYSQYRARQQEEILLTNIRRDLKEDLFRIEENLDLRKKKIVSGKKLIALSEGRPAMKEKDINEAFFHVINEDVFQPNNITVTELINSGNLNQITSDSIQEVLLQLQFQYKTHNDGLAHERFDYEEYISKPFFQTINFKPLMPKYYGKEYSAKYTISEINKLLGNTTFINGCQLRVVINEAYFLYILQEIKSLSEKAIELIETDLKD